MQKAPEKNNHNGVTKIPMKRGLALLAGWLLGTQLQAAELAVVVDDLGYSLERAERVLALPDAVALGMLPFAPMTADIVRRARITGHEIILHQPMEPLPANRHHAARGTLTVDMSPEHFAAQIDEALRAVPGIVGVNNHTGSRLTQDADAMRRLMGHIAARNLLFLDSRTTADTVAYAMAREARIPALQRDVFLDHVASTEAIEAEFHRAVAIARRRGYAVIIAHPHDASLSYLQRTLSRLPDGVTLVPLTRLISRDRPATLARAENPASPHRSLGQ